MTIHSTFYLSCSQITDKKTAVQTLPPPLVVEVITALLRTLVAGVCAVKG